MKRIYIQDHWPLSWKISYPYDLEEVYGKISVRGYAYAYKNRREQTLRMLKEVVEPGSRILDVAGAQGNFSIHLAEMGYKVTWNDLREELAGYVRLKYEYGDLSFAPGNVFDLQFPCLFDAVLVTEIIEHVAHPDEFLLKVAKLIRPGGWIIMTTPNGAYFLNKLPAFSECADPSIYEEVQFKPNSDGHIFLLHPKEIEGLADNAGLLVDQLSLFTSTLTAGHVKLEFALNMLPRWLVDRLEGLIQGFPMVLKQKFLVQMGVRFQKIQEQSAE